MRPFALLCSAAMLGGCTSLLGDAPDVDYTEVIVPIVTDCTQRQQEAVGVMEVGFAKVRAACEAFFVDATRFQQNALATNTTADLALAGAATILPLTNSAATAVKALAITTAGITFGKSVMNHLVTNYSFGTYLQKVRQLANADMDNFTAAARAKPPTNACRAYSLVQELAIKCTLAALKDIESQQMNIPSEPKVATVEQVTVSETSNGPGGPPTRKVTRTRVPINGPAVGVTIGPK